MELFIWSYLYGVIYMELCGSHSGANKDSSPVECYALSTGK